MLAKPKTAKEEPMREKLRSDTDEPMVEKPSTDKAELKRTTP